MTRLQMKEDKRKDIQLTREQMTDKHKLIDSKKQEYTWIDNTNDDSSNDKEYKRQRYKFNEKRVQMDRQNR